MSNKNKDLTIGAKIEINNTPYIIIENIFMNPGRGQAFNKLKLKNILTEALITKTIKSGEKIKQANIITDELTYLYNNEQSFFFYNEHTSEYHEINEDKIKNIKIWLKEGAIYTFTFWESNIIDVKAPKFIELKVFAADILDKKTCAAKNSKYAEMETGVQIKVPNFIKDNDIIKIDTEKQTYISRTN